MLRKIILGIAALALILITVNAEGIGILDAAKQAGFEITCPDGVVNCSEGADYSIVGTQIFILKILGGLLNFVALAAVLMLIIAGLRLVVAMGNQEQLQAAKKHILWILGGLAVIILSLLIVKNVTEAVYRSTLPSSDCGNGILEEGEECDGLEGVSEGEECSDECELLMKCLTLKIDGLLGPDTDVARKETQNLAVTFVESLATNCLHTGKTVVKMPPREDGEPMCLSVKQFQEAYNRQTCDRKTGTREDVALPKCEVKIPESCYEGDPSGIQNEKFPNCDASVKLQPICDQLEIGGDCTIEKVQKELKEYYDDQNVDCSQEDGKYGQCTVKAIENYFAENDCEDKVAVPAEQPATGESSDAATSSSPTTESNIGSPQTSQPVADSAADSLSPTNTGDTSTGTNADVGDSDSDSTTITTDGATTTTTTEGNTTTIKTEYSDGSKMIKTITEINGVTTETTTIVADQESSEANDAVMEEWSNFGKEAEF